MDKEEYLQKALKANEEAVKNAKLSDMTDKNSSFYQGLNTPPVAPEPVSVPKEVDPDALPRLRTLQDDVADAVKKDQLSLSRVALAEAKKKEAAEESTVEKKSWVTIAAIVLGLMLILGGLGAIGFVMYGKYKPASSLPITQNATEFIRFDNEAVLKIQDTNSRAIQAAITQELKNPSSQDSLRHLRFVTEVDGVPTDMDLFSLLASVESRMPSELVRNLKNQFFLGVNFNKGTGEPFLILEGNSYENMYPGLLAWEATMAEDMMFLFGGQAADANLSTFKDGVISNKNVRQFTGADGSSRFFYSVVDQTTIVFATSQTTFDEILKRFREKKVGQ